MTYNSSMKSLKKGFLHFFISSFFIFVPAAPCLAAPDSEVFPPLPLDQEEHEDNAKDRKFPHPPFDSENIMKIWHAYLALKFYELLEIWY